MDPGNSVDNTPGRVVPDEACADDTQADGRDPHRDDAADRYARAPDASITNGASVRTLAVRGSAWALTGNLAQQFLRLASNLILTRLLLPEAFGLMALVAVVLTGLQMFSDIGIGPSIIQHKRGESPGFLNTAWTIQIVRGLVLGLVAALVIGPLLYFVVGPLALRLSPDEPPVYADPLLMPLICVAALSAVISGFNSTKLFTASRRLAIGRLIVLELGVQVCGVLALCSWAWYYHSVWALVGGGLVTAYLKMVLSHLVLPGEPNRLCFEREAFDDLISFGRWIFLSTATLFIAAQGDRLLLAGYLTKAMLGVYSIAYFLSESLANLVWQISRRVFLPAFSRVARESPETLKDNYYRVRLRLDALALPATGGLMVLGTQVVEFLYPGRYADAGWMLQILAVRVAFACTLPPTVSCLLAIGDSKGVFASNLGKTVMLLVGIPVGWHYGQLVGVIWVIALSELGSLPVLWWRMAGRGLLSLRREALAPVFVGLGLGAGWLVRIALSWL